MGLPSLLLALASGLHLRGETSADRLDNGTSVTPTQPAPPNSPARGGRPLLWYHVHKCAGTLLCSVARASGERVVTPNNNCNWMPGPDGVRDIGGVGYPEPSCAHRAQYFAQGGFTWGAVEKQFRSPHPCPQFAYATMLRDSAALVESIAGDHGHEFGPAPLAPLRAAVQLLQAPDASHVLAAANSTAGYLPAWKWLDNFQTRVFADALDVPPGKLTTDHLEKAKRVLEKFVVVEVLSELQSDAPRLVRALQWPAHLQHAFTRKVNVGRPGHEQFFTPAQKQFLHRQNRFDRQLVDHFRPR